MGWPLLVEALTENRNRTGAEVRHAFSKQGGSLGEPGSVAYLFDKKGTIVIDAERYSEDELMVAVEAGAEDILHRRGRLRGRSPSPRDFTAVRKALRGRGRGDRERRDLAFRPSSLVPIDEGQAAKLMRLIEPLEDNDDVSAVHANFDVAADVLERVAG